MPKPNDLYTAYLETDHLAKTYRIAELEAALLYVLNLNEHRHNKDAVYIRATTILNEGFSYSQETTDKYKELTYGS